MKKLVVIDDESDFCTLVTLQCKKNGIECRYANTLAEGVELVNDFVPDILILDNNLPDGLGWQKAEYFLQEYPHLQLHLITAKNSFEVSKENEQTNAKQVVVYSKPLSLGQLDNIILQHNV